MTPSSEDDLPVSIFHEIASGVCADVGLAPITLAGTCEAAARTLGHEVVIPETDNSEEVPEGCVISEATDNDRLLLSVNPSARLVNASLLTRSLCTSLVPHFQEILNGTCADVGLSTIALEAVCEDARRALGVLHSAQRPTELALPKGCFVHRGVQALFSNDAATIGSGAGSLAGDPVTEICMSYVAPATTASEELEVILSTTTTEAEEPGEISWAVDGARPGHLVIAAAAAAAWQLIFLASHVLVQ